LIAEDGGNFEQFATKPIAYKISGKSWVNNHAHVLKAKSNYLQDFIFYSLEHKDIQFFITGGTRSKLNRSELNRIEFFIPTSLTEQQKIAQILSTIDRSIELFPYFGF
jgi:type I restriction enzyme S subunit